MVNNFNFKDEEIIENDRVNISNQEEPQYFMNKNVKNLELSKKNNPIEDDLSSQNMNNLASQKVIHKAVKSKGHVKSSEEIKQISQAKRKLFDSNNQTNNIVEDKEETKYDNYQMSSTQSKQGEHVNLAYLI